MPPKKKQAALAKIQTASVSPWERTWLDVAELKDDKHTIEAAAARKTCKDELEKIEAQRKRYTKPLLDSKREIDSDAKAVSAPWTTLLNHINKLVTKRKQALQAIEMKKVERRAKRFEKKGNTDMAEDVRQAGLAAPVLQNVGVKTRPLWSAEVKSIKDLCAAVAAGHVPVDAVEAKLPYLNSIARKMKQVDLGIPGVIGVVRDVPVDD